VALIVEDGSGRPDANGYAVVAEADAYWQDRDNAVWAGATTAAKEAGLIQATQFLDAGFAWRGSRIDRDQALDWPRIGAVDDEGLERDSNSVPTEIKQATFELALQALSGALLPAESRGGLIDRVKAGSVEVEFAERAPAGRTYEFVERIIDGLTEGSARGATVELFRA
jgi:hypothetical protein